MLLYRSHLDRIQIYKWDLKLISNHPTCYLFLYLPRHSNSFSVFLLYWNLIFRVYNVDFSCIFRYIFVEWARKHKSLVLNTCYYCFGQETRFRLINWFVPGGKFFPSNPTRWLITRSAWKSRIREHFLNERNERGAINNAKIASLTNKSVDNFSILSQDNGPALYKSVIN